MDKRANFNCAGHCLRTYLKKCIGFELMISRALIEVTNTAADLTASPIDPSWIIKGNPVAQSSLLTKSADGLTWTMVWQCSEGSFHWYYDIEETLVILEGSVVLENKTMNPTRHGPGDIIFFKDGAHAKWHVEGHVRKLAFLRTTSPVLLSYAVRGFSRIKRTIRTRQKRK